MRGVDIRVHPCSSVVFSASNFALKIRIHG